MNGGEDLSTELTTGKKIGLALLAIAFVALGILIIVMVVMTF